MGYIEDYIKKEAMIKEFSEAVSYVKSNIDYPFDKISGYLEYADTKDTLGFVRYLLIPTKCPIIINWNLGSKVSDQVCENDIRNRKINTFKCLVSGDISLSWNKNNILNL